MTYLLVVHDVLEGGAEHGSRGGRGVVQRSELLQSRGQVVDIRLPVHGADVLLLTRAGTYNTCIRTQMQTYTNAYIHTTHTYVHKCIQHIHTYTNAYNTYTHSAVQTKGDEGERESTAQHRERGQGDHRKDALDTSREGEGKRARNERASRKGGGTCPGKECEKLRWQRGGEGTSQRGEGRASVLLSDESVYVVGGIARGAGAHHTLHKTLRRKG